MYLVLTKVTLRVCPAVTQPSLQTSQTEVGAGIDYPAHTRLLSTSTGRRGFPVRVRHRGREPNLRSY